MDDFNKPEHLTGLRNKKIAKKILSSISDNINSIYRDHLLDGTETIRHWDYTSEYNNMSMLSVSLDTPQHNGDYISEGQREFTETVRKGILQSWNRYQARLSDGVVGCPIALAKDNPDNELFQYLAEEYQDFKERYYIIIDFVSAFYIEFKDNKIVIGQSLKYGYTKLIGYSEPLSELIKTLEIKNDENVLNILTDEYLVNYFTCRSVPSKTEA